MFTMKTPHGTFKIGMLQLDICPVLQHTCDMRKSCVFLQLLIVIYVSSNNYEQLS